MDAAVNELEKESYINLATFRRDGTAVNTPVWFAIRDGAIYVFTDGTSFKVKRLRRDERVRVAPCTVTGSLTGEWRDGRARIVEERSTIDAAYAALHAKYGVQMSLVNLVSRLAGRIGRRAMLEIRLG